MGGAVESCSHIRASPELAPAAQTSARVDALQLEYAAVPHVEEHCRLGRGDCLPGVLPLVSEITLVVPAEREPLSLYRFHRVKYPHHAPVMLFAFTDNFGGEVGVLNLDNVSVRGDDVGPVVAAPDFSPVGWDEVLPFSVPCAVAFGPGVAVLECGVRPVPDCDGPAFGVGG